MTEKPVHVFNAAGKVYARQNAQGKWVLSEKDHWLTFGPAATDQFRRQLISVMEKRAQDGTLWEDEDTSRKDAALAETMRTDGSKGS